MGDSRRGHYRTRFFLLLDTLGGVTRLPVQLLLWLLKGLYLTVCMVSWGLILWILGEKHIGILKLLIFLASGLVWVLIFSSIYSCWS